MFKACLSDSAKIDLYPSAGLLVRDRVIASQRSLKDDVSLVVRAVLFHLPHGDRPGFTGSDDPQRRFRGRRPVLVFSPRVVAGLHPSALRPVFRPISHQSEPVHSDRHAAVSHSAVGILPIDRVDTHPAPRPALLERWRAHAHGAFGAIVEPHGAGGASCAA